MNKLVAVTGDAVAVITDGVVSLGLRGSGAQCLARAGDTLYVGCRGGGVWASGDAARSWRELPFPQRDVFSVAISPADGAVYAGCEPSALFRSDDGGETWRELESLRHIPSAPTWSFPPRPWTSHVRWIAPSPHDPALLLVGIELGGVMRSVDGGETWQDHRPGAKLDAHALVWHPVAPGRAYETGGDGTAWSLDGGERWEPLDEGRDRHYSWALAVHPEEADTWFCSASTGPRQAHGGDSAAAYVYRWRGEGPWQALDGGLSQPLHAMPYALLYAEARLYAGLSDGRLFVSDDDGDSWSPLGLSGEPLPRILALA
jgi:photosystem II stability/assembly factor-like uncharacterized protein